MYHRLDKDIENDFVIPKCKVFALSETWLENDRHCNIKGSRMISQFKRQKIRAGGVAIYENIDSSAQSLQAAKHEIYV